MSHFATLVSSRLKLWNESRTNRARIADSSPHPFRSPQHLALTSDAGTRSSLADVNKRRFSVEFLKIGVESEVEESQAESLRLRDAFVSLSFKRDAAVVAPPPLTSRASFARLGPRRGEGKRSARFHGIESKQVVDGRVEPGHDEPKAALTSPLPLAGFEAFFSPPPCGEGSGVGVATSERIAWRTPTPNPSPQGGGEKQPPADIRAANN
jgi:hypothetical protein